MKLLEKYFLPSDYFKEFQGITPQYLKERGIRAVIIDLDNTLVGFDEPSASETVLKWFRTMKDNGIKVTIVSNGSRVRVSEFSDPHDIEYIFRARKPLAPILQEGSAHDGHGQFRDRHDRRPAAHRCIRSEPGRSEEHPCPSRQGQGWMGDRRQSEDRTHHHEVFRP